MGPKGLKASWKSARVGRRLTARLPWAAWLTGASLPGSGCTSQRPLPWVLAGGQVGARTASPQDPELASLALFRQMQLCLFLKMWRGRGSSCQLAWVLPATVPIRFLRYGGSTTKGTYLPSTFSCASFCRRPCSFCLPCFCQHPPGPLSRGPFLQNSLRGGVRDLPARAICTGGEGEVCFLQRGLLHCSLPQGTHQALPQGHRLQPLPGSGHPCALQAASAAPA